MHSVNTTHVMPRGSTRPASAHTIVRYFAKHPIETIITNVTADPPVFHAISREWSWENLPLELLPTLHQAKVLPQSLEYYLVSQGLL
jgi:hypothetical protein